MSKKQGPRGEHGILGRPGPVGRQGPVGPRGKTGARGTTGATGRRGTDGARGETGPVTPDNHLNAIAAVHDQIEHIHHELDVQMKRMAQLQMELDDVRATLRRLMGDSTLTTPSVAPQRSADLI